MAFGDYYPATPGTFWWQAPGGGQVTFTTCTHGGLPSMCPYCAYGRPAWPAEVPKGWECKCGVVFAPSVTQCPYCPQQQPAAVEAVPPSVDDECVPPEEGGTCAGGRHCSC